LNTNFPKKIWFLWLQGLDDAPLIIKKCYDSWLRHNPGWQIIFLHEGNIAEHIDLPARRVTNQAFSDILRINLLAKHGGVWVDATCFCTKPLDEWLYDYTQSGFFAFERPGPDRMISSWFMAADKYNYLTSTYQHIVNTYWDNNPKMHFIENSHWRFLSKYMQRSAPGIWFGGFVTKLLKVHPYFWFHYLFEEIYSRNENFKEIWDNTPKISADIPHQLQFNGLFNPITDDVKTAIDNKTAPLYKLTWKFEPSQYKKGTIIDYLLNNG